jgi:hypothetical protein
MYKVHPNSEHGKRGSNGRAGRAREFEDATADYYPLRIARAHAPKKCRAARFALESAVMVP